MAEFKVQIPSKYINSVIFRQETGFDLYYRDGELFVSGCDSLDEAKEALKNHNPTKPAEPTIDEKLASVGLSLADLKVALGINA